MAAAWRQTAVETLDLEEDAMADGTERAVGDPVRSLCTRCKKATRHVVVSLVGGEPARVQCTTCEGVHNYRDPAGREKAPAAKGAPPLRTSEEEWLAQMKGRDPKQAIPYGEATHPRTGDLVEHPTFGYGYVLKVLPPNKVEVHFRQGVRLLRW